MKYINFAKYQMSDVQLFRYLATNVYSFYIKGIPNIVFNIFFIVFVSFVKIHFKF